ncbi:hypothetical protein EJ110_NYTH02679 [Nymphaea thermarum]|nr:hypothetical protein EJ110_NYTH02679 [Nymphaea thermarum]
MGVYSCTVNPGKHHFAHEITHSLQKSSRPSSCLKLDLSKAYDSVNWRFLENVMFKLGFSEAKVARVMSCVSLASTAVTGEWGAREFFELARGLPHGNPISPYLFILVMEVLSRGIKCRVFPLPFHSGNGGINECIRTALGWRVGSLLTTYLGLPLFAGKLKAEWCHNLIAKVDKRLASWKLHVYRMLSVCVCRNIQVSYWTLVFVLPKRGKDKLTSAMADFLWGRSEGSQPHHLICWDKVCRSVARGGTGLIRIDDWAHA